jgi:hypothetical protein
MALRNAESETFENVATATAEPKAAPKIEPEVSNSKPGSAVAAAAKTAIGAAMKFKPALESYENVIDASDLFGVFPKIIVNLGGFKIDENRPEGMPDKLGTSITVNMASWNKRWLASPGSDDAEAKKFVKYSNDGKTIAEDGSSLADYVAQLKEVEGFKNASIKEYFAIWGFMTAYGTTEIAPAEQCMVELQCSPQTVGQFKRHMIEHGMKVSQGLMTESNILKCHAKSGSFNSKDYGYASFTAG